VNRTHLHDFSNFFGANIFLTNDFFRHRNNPLKIPGLFQVFHDRTNPVKCYKSTVLKTTFDFSRGNGTFILLVKHPLHANAFFTFCSAHKGSASVLLWLPEPSLQPRAAPGSWRWPTSPSCRSWPREGSAPHRLAGPPGSLPLSSPPAPGRGTKLPNGGTAGRPLGTRRWPTAARREKDTRFRRWHHCWYYSINGRKKDQMATKRHGKCQGDNIKWFMPLIVFLNDTLWPVWDTWRGSKLISINCTKNNYVWGGLLTGAMCRVSRTLQVSHQKPRKNANLWNCVWKIWMSCMGGWEEKLMGGTEGQSSKGAGSGRLVRAHYRLVFDIQKDKSGLSFPFSINVFHPIAFTAPRILMAACKNLHYPEDKELLHLQSFSQTTC